LTIEGRPVTTRQTLPVVNPATGEVFAQAPACSADQLADAVRTAAAAHVPWAQRSMDERRSYLRACGETVAAHAAEIADVLTTEQGKPLAQARSEVDLAASWFARTAALDLGSAPLVDEPDRLATMRRVPLGVVAAVAPFNFPIILSVCKIAPALLAGNSVVVKPAPVTPLSTLLVTRLLADVLPPGVLSAVSGGPELGAALTASPEVAMISFTGSIGVGRAIAESAAAGFKRVLLELGGNDPAIVLPGTAPEAVADELFARSMVNSGQFCAAVKRVYVPRDRQSELVELLGELARTAAVGDGRDPRSAFGPLTTRAQTVRAAALVDEAVAAGGRIAARSEVPGDGRGFFHPVTVITGLPAGTRLERDEQFAPVIPVIGYDDPADAVRAANATEFGLGASLWGDPGLADELAPRIDAGTVWINTHGDLRHDVPFGGARHSGMGVEYGYWGLLEYTRIAVTHRFRPAAAQAPASS
jgi:acyl-CoA reductase-like NAD-dependent aldehyde dehydrogenase